MSLRDRLRHLWRHPRSVLPGAPVGIINDARAWVHMQRQLTPVDIRRGPVAAVYERHPETLQPLCEARDAATGLPVTVDRLMPISPAAVFFLRGARIIGDEGVVVSSDNRVFSEFTYVDQSGGVDLHSIFRRRRFPRPKFLRGWYATLCYPSARAYFHWLIESLPRLALLQGHLETLDGLIVPDGLERTVAESLRLLGFDSARLVVQGIGSHYAPEHLLVPAYCAGRNIPEWVPEFLRTQYLRKGAVRAASRRVYVSRGDASKRNVLNEAQLLPILDKFGFSVVKAREHSFSEQASLFSDADVVVGPHGAGLANALFCTPGAQLLELLPSRDVAPGPFHSVASVAGMSYWVLYGNRRDTSAVPDVHANFVIDPEMFERALSRVLGSP